MYIHFIKKYKKKNWVVKEDFLVFKHFILFLGH